jgi:serine/threonine protein kinase/ABC-type sugar transport system substrate-binding protein
MQSDLFTGRQLNGFTVQERIGRGGMATVYRAYQPSVNRSVALKIIVLDANQGERDEFRQRFAQEAKVVASLEHIHILPIYDYGIYDDEVAFLAMRLLRGGSLADLLNEGKPLDLERTAEIFTQIARGLAYAHSKGIIHRDLKPSNILMDDAGNAYLTDFGLAKLIEDSVELTRTGHIVGTPVYMSPEQLRGETLDPRSDIYSLGVILYHMLVGKPPFDASDTNMVSVIYQHLEKAPVPPREHNPNVPEQVEIVALKALQKNPAERYNTADEMANELNMALGRKISTASYPAVHMTSSQQRGAIVIPTTRRRLMLSGALALVVLAVSLGLVGLLTSPGGLLSQPTPTPQPTLTPTPLPAATVLTGVSGKADDARPSQEEVTAAQTRLGSEGFIAMVTCNRTSEYHSAQVREIADFARAYNLAIRIYDSANDAYNQLTLIEQARGDGALGIILCPLNIELLQNALQSVQAARLPLVLLASNVPSYGGVQLPGDDYLMGVEAGREAGRIIRDELSGRANVIILDFPSRPDIVTRANGLQDGVLEIAPNADVVGRYLGGTRENGNASVTELIEQGVEFDVILSINDNGSFGAIEALEAAGFTPDSVIITSIDAETQARDYILQGKFMRASVDIGREMFSRVAVDAMVKLLAGSTLPERFLVPPGQVVTRDILQAQAESTQAESS